MELKDVLSCFVVAFITGITAYLITYKVNCIVYAAMNNLLFLGIEPLMAFSQHLYCVLNFTPISLLVGVVVFFTFLAVLLGALFIINALGE